VVVEPAARRSTRGESRSRVVDDLPGENVAVLGHRFELHREGRAGCERLVRSLPLTEIPSDEDEDVTEPAVCSADAQLKAPAGMLAAVLGAESPA